MENSTKQSNGSLVAIVKIASNLTAACLIAGGIIAVSYAVTRPYILKNRVQLVQDSMRQLIPNAQFTAVKDHANWFKAQIGEQTVGYIMTMQPRGYGGAISIMAAADTAGCIINYNILAHNETPGLGDLADKPKFKQQFKGKKASALVVVKNGDPTKIDALSGATITSNAVTKGIREELEKLDAFLQLPSGATDVAPADK